MEFVNLETNLVFTKPKPKGEHEACVRGDSGMSECLEAEFFRITNLFSELHTEYLRIKARLNLGISEDSSLKWGNIKGSLGNQSDLINYLSEQLASTKQYLEDYLDLAIKNINVNDLGESATIYYGPSPSNLTLTNKRTFTTGDYEYIYVAVPNSKEALSVNGIQGGFTYVGITLLDNNIFYLYRSDNKNLGETTITYGN